MFENTKKNIEIACDRHILHSKRCRVKILPFFHDFPKNFDIKSAQELQERSQTTQPQVGLSFRATHAAPFGSDETRRWRHVHVELITFFLASSSTMLSWLLSKPE